MATILLSAAGAAIGSGFGGAVLGVSGAVIGRAAGAALGRVIDQKLLGAGSEAVEVGRVDRFRLMGASEGAAVAQVFGRARIAGQVIWATRFAETAVTSGGGKGAPRPQTTQYSYSVSLAVGLCEGAISGIGRLWADGTEIAPNSLNLRVYKGGEDQLPDPKIEAVEGQGLAPAYRGIAYVVIEDLDLGRFGNRVPQLSFEVIRPAQGVRAAAMTDLAGGVRAVALIPGTGEYSLATTQVHYAEDEGITRSANVHSPSGKTDFATSLEQMREELPACGSVSLVVSWFGSDLRCGECRVQPKVEQTAQEGVGMVWQAGGIGREVAAEVVREGGSSVYGGTPADRAVIEAIQAIRAGGQEVMFYPFLLMDQLAGNALPDPWSEQGSQAILPWRGRITLSRAPGQAGTPDRSVAAEAEVAAFFGDAQPADFSIADGEIAYSGTQDWRYRRFILHYAHLCALAGGVDAFCIGSEMVALTQIRGAGDSFPAVAALRQLAADVRAVLGPGTRISYAADWSEYFGCQMDGNRYFHLDPLWADENIDFVGIDNYMPLSDWRDGETHADAAAGSIYGLEYLKANIAGGEGYDWFYDSAEAEAAQRRTPIADDEHGEPWIWRYKDICNWWSQPHHERIGGERRATPTDWIPQSKPIRFTEYGCAAIDKGTNQPNKFLDPKSSESSLPRHSTGRRDDLMQMQYLRAMSEYWADANNNPVSALYGARMVDMARAHVWAWDARPFPWFPNAAEIWSDGGNYTRGHWLNGRAASQPLEAVVADICERSGMRDFDVSSLRGLVRGYSQGDLASGRAVLQPLMLACGFDASEREGVLRFSTRDGRPRAALEPEQLAVHPDLAGDVETHRSAQGEAVGRVLVGFVEAEGDYQLRQEEAHWPDAGLPAVSQSELPLVLTAAESRGVAERWLAEAQVAQEGIRFALPKSALHLGVGDVVDVGGNLYRIDASDQGEALLLEGVRVDPGVFRPSDAVEERVAPRAFSAPAPVVVTFLDLPLLKGDEVPHAPYAAIAARPWPGAVAIWDAVDDAGYEVNRLVGASASLGRTESELARARAGLWDRKAPLRVRLSAGSLSDATESAVLAGANAMAIGDEATGIWEVFQFQRAELVAPRTYELSVRLRGQLGTDAVMPEAWPINSRVVLLDRTIQQIDLAASGRGLARHYRVGAAGRGYDDPNVVHRQAAFAGVGLRPYAPVHLQARWREGGLLVTWVRRTRIDGDNWQQWEVPLGELVESYLVRVWRGVELVREASVVMAQWTYAAAEIAADGGDGTARIEVAQISDRFGPGPFRAITVAL